MSGFIDNLTSLGQFLSKLSWKKILQLFVLVIIVGFTWIAFSTSDQILGYLKSDRVLLQGHLLKKLSPKTAAELDVISSKSDIIAGISVNMMNFQRNAQYIIHISMYDKALAEIFAHHEVLNSEYPIFTQNQVSNRRFISLINGDFVCSPYTPEMFISRSIPDSMKDIQYVCTSGIPPYYGRFVGVVCVLLKRIPTAEEVDQLRVVSKKLAVVIYERDIK